MAAPSTELMMISGLLMLNVFAVAPLAFVPGVCEFGTM
jgi:hypothetical protein